MKKYIFLDIDGVLVCSNYNIMRYVIKQDPENDESDMIWDGTKKLDPRNVLAFKMLWMSLESKGYDVSLVITSTWRSNMEEVKTVFQSYGIDVSKIDKIEDDMASSRGKLILRYCLKNNIDIQDIIIIDDETSDIIDVMPKNTDIIKSDFVIGLTLYQINHFLDGKKLYVDDKYIKGNIVLDAIDIEKIPSDQLEKSTKTLKENKDEGVHIAFSSIQKKHV